MTTPKFKIGDKVRCVTPKNSENLPECMVDGGCGFEEGLVFVIKEISDVENYPIYWPGKDRNGVYEPWLETAEIDNWQEKFEGL